MPRPKKGEEKQKPRPLIIIDWNRVDQLLQADCSGDEIAAFLGIHHDTLYDRCYSDKGVTWTAYKASKNSHGKALLRAAQYNKALKGSDRLLVHLGEHMLGQVKQEKIEHTGNININIKQFRISQPTDILEIESDG
jgi:hypothetical protein